MPMVRCAAVHMKLPAGVAAAYESKFGQTIGIVTTSIGSKNPNARPVTEAEILALWQKLIQAFGGDKALALQCATSNPTVLHPRYTNPSLIMVSKAALVQVMGSETEARDVMLQNPAILQCGDSLKVQTATQIKQFASFRAAVDRVPQSVSQAVLFGVFALILSNFALVRSGDEAAQLTADFVRPLLGTAGASLFIATLGLSAKAEADASAARRAREGRK